MFNITVNGEQKKFDSKISIAEIVAQFELDIEKIAIERNQEILHQENYSKTMIEDGDAIEIIHFVGGG